MRSCKPSAEFGIVKDSEFDPVAPTTPPPENSQTARDLYLRAVNEIGSEAGPRRSDDSIIATVTSGLSINSLCEGRGDSFRKNFLGLHVVNPPNVC